MNFEYLKPLDGVSINYPSANDQPETQAIMNFAKSNDFEFYLEKNDLINYDWQNKNKAPAWMSYVSDGFLKLIYNFTSGDYMGYPIQIFMIRDSDNFSGVIKGIGNISINNRSTLKESAGIVRIILPKLFPQVLLYSRRNYTSLSSMRVQYKISQRLNLEGDFNDYYDLYIPEGVQIDALALLSPNMMQLLKDCSGLFSVEFYGNELILMTQGSIYDPNVMAKLDEILKEQLSYLRNLEFSWRYIPKNTPFDMLEKTILAGRSFKVGRLVVPPWILCLGVILSMILMISIGMLARG